MDTLRGRESHAPCPASRLWRFAHPRQTKANASAILAAGLTLRDCQLVIAREYGFDSWPKLLVEVPNAAPRRIKLREAIYANEIALVQSILERHPDLISTAIDVWQRRPCGSRLYATGFA